MTTSGQWAEGSGQTKQSPVGGGQSLRRALGGVASLAALLCTIAAAGGRLYAQCPMCYAAAASQGPQARHALNVGILLLIVPVVSIIGGIATFTYRNREPK